MAWTSADMAEMRRKLNEKAIEIGRLNAKIESDAKVIAALRETLKDCADDLEAEVEARYSHGIKEHPAMAPKYERDMEPVIKARKILATNEQAAEKTDG